MIDVIGAGFGRTGRATADWPAAAFWRELAEAYPDAKVILTTRDEDTWFESSDQIRGYVMHSVDWRRVPPARVVGADGEFVRREPLIDDELWFKVQDVLAANSRPRSDQVRGVPPAPGGLLRLLRGALHRVNRNYKGMNSRARRRRATSSDRYRA